MLIYFVTNLLSVWGWFGSLRFAPLAKWGGKKTTNEDECALLASWFIQLPTKAIFKAPLRPWWGRATRCVIFTHVGLPAVSSPRDGAPAHTQAAPAFSHAAWAPALNQRLWDFCCPFSTIDVVEWKWSAQLEAASRQHFPQVSYVRPPPERSFLFQPNITLRVGTFTLSQVCHYF